MPDEVPDVPSHGDEHPVLYALSREASGYRLTRRSLLEAATVVGASTALTGCGTRNEASGVDLKQLGGGRVLMDGATACPYRAHTQAASGLALTPDGELLASGSTDGTLKLWSLPGGDLMKRVNAKVALCALGATADGQQLAGASQSSADLHFWSLPDGAVDGQPLAVGRPGWPLATSPDGAALATGAGLAVQLWSTFGRTLLGELRQHSDQVTSLAFSPNGKLLACASRDRTISIWSIPSRTLLGVATGHTRAVTGVCFAGRSRVLSAADDGTIRLWSTDGTAIQILAEGNAGGAVVAASRSGQRVATGNGNSIRLWDPPGDTPARTLAAHAAPATCLAFAQDGRFLVSGDQKGCVLLWDLRRFGRCWALWDVWVDKQIEVRLCRKELATVTTMVCACDLVWAAAESRYTHTTCLCNTVVLNPLPNAAGKPQSSQAMGPGGCVCDLICTCNTICTCNAVEPVDRGGGGGHYWHPS